MDTFTAMLVKVSTQPGKPASVHVQHASDGRTLREMEKYGLVVFKSGGWFLTGKGDLRLAEAMLQDAQRKARENGGQA